MDRTYRQKIVDEYLNESGENRFVPQDFLDWLSDKPDHRAHSLFFAKSDADAAQAYRLGLVRSFVSGLRVTVAVSMAPFRAKKVNVTIRVPAYISPGSGRREGGGYMAVDMADPATLREMARQAALDLRRVMERHDGIAKVMSIDLSVLGSLAAFFDRVATEKRKAA